MDLSPFLLVQKCEKCLNTYVILLVICMKTSYSASLEDMDFLIVPFSNNISPTLWG